MTKQQLQDELKQAMLAKDTMKTSVLRMLISAIGYYEIQKGGANYEATDEDVMSVSVIQREVKQHRDSIEQFKNAGRQELVEKEEKELGLLQKYLPAQMSEDEVKKLVSEAVAQSGASSPQDMGKVMAVLMPKIKGKADGSLVSKLVKEALSK
jgi:uncharacterized protein YqeY